MANIYEGAYWQAQITKSNRYPDVITFTSCSSDEIFTVSRNQAESIAIRLESGEDPDQVAKSLPIEFQY